MAGMVQLELPDSNIFYQEDGSAMLWIASIIDTNGEVLQTLAIAENRADAEQAISVANPGKTIALVNPFHSLLLRLGTEIDKALHNS